MVGSRDSLSSGTADSDAASNDATSSSHEESHGGDVLERTATNFRIMRQLFYNAEAQYSNSFDDMLAVVEANEAKVENYDMMAKALEEAKEQLRKKDDEAKEAVRENDKKVAKIDKLEWEVHQLTDEVKVLEKGDSRNVEDICALEKELAAEKEGRQKDAAKFETKFETKICGLKKALAAEKEKMRMLEGALKQTNNVFRAIRGYED